MKHEVLDTSIAKKPTLILATNEWNRLPNSWLFAVIPIFQIEKFVREFSFSGISSLNISAIYMKVPYKAVPYRKHEYLECCTATSYRS